MRYFHLLISALIILSTTTKAQTGFGPEIGLGMSKMRFAPPLSFTAASVSGIASGKIGGLIDKPLNKHVFFQAGLSFSRKGAVREFSYYTNDSFSEAVNQTLSIYYIDLPLNVIWKSGRQGHGRLIAGVGATPSYIIAGKNKLHDNFVSQGVRTVTEDNTNIIVGQTVKGFDIGLNITAGYELATGLFFRGYYTIGVSDIGPGTEIDKNRMFGLAAGYLFGKGRNANKDTDGLIDKSKD